MITKLKTFCNCSTVHDDLILVIAHIYSDNSEIELFQTPEHSSTHYNAPVNSKSKYM